MPIAKPVRYDAENFILKDANGSHLADWLVDSEKADEIIAALNRESDASLDMVLWCPQCLEQHIDEAKPDVCERCGHERDDHDNPLVTSMCAVFKAWLNPPHKSHRCHFCNYVWRPADGCTNGVFALKTTKVTDGSAKPVSFATERDFNDAVAYASRRESDAWIPTSERLPKKSIECQITDIEGVVWGDVDFYASDKTFRCWVDGKGKSNGEIVEAIAWMPLPKPFEMEGK